MMKGESTPPVLAGGTDNRRTPKYIDITLVVVR